MAHAYPLSPNHHLPPTPSSHSHARRPGREPFPPTWTVPGASVFNAFYNLGELVSSTLPFTGGDGTETHGGGRRAEEAADGGGDAAAPAPPPSEFADSSKSLYRRGVDAVRLLADLASGGGSDDGVSDATYGAAAAAGSADLNDDAPTTSSSTRRRLVGGVPVRNAGAPAALFCDLEAAPPPAAQQLAFGVDVTTGRLRSQRRLQRLWDGYDGDGVEADDGASASAAPPPAGPDDSYSENDPDGGAPAPASTSRRLWAAGAAAYGNRSSSGPQPFSYRSRWPFLRFAVEQWCALARLTPSALAAFGVVNPKTLLIPDAYAFLRFNEGACSKRACRRQCRGRTCVALAVEGRATHAASALRLTF
jgi:hypothetical protein